MRLPARLVEHLESPDVGRIIYGSIVGLALVVALQFHPPTAGQAAAAIVGTALAIGLAEVYSDLIAGEARTHRPIRRTELRHPIEAAAAVFFGAGFPAIFFVLASAGAIDVHLAFTLSKWTGLGLICVYGFVAARLAGRSVARALLHAALVGAIAGALIAFKAVLH
jgi:VIT1/CCC1 family predicted Fe2+/Mn2+ transporter